MFCRTFVPYYHVVFTLPAAIADIAYQNKAVVYDLLFKVSAETMLTIAADPRRLGARKRSLTQKPWRQGTPSPGNDSASQARSASVGVQKVEYRVRYLAELNVASAQLVGDVHGHVTGPALEGVEGNNADRMPILALH
jgi:hypothetical protein